jgi:glycosyltransferase involved in cell wall biosynthesis
MRIAWCTPFHPRSAIGRVSQAVVGELQKTAEIDVWHPPVAELLETKAPQIPFAGGPGDAARLATYDFVVYNIGNHVANHWAIFEAARRTPGIVVLHDLSLQEFFSGGYLQSPELKPHYTAAVGRWYGEQGLAAVASLVDGVSGEFLASAGVLDFPLFEEAIAGAYAVVTHAPFASRRVAAVFPGIVHTLALPHCPSRITPAGSRKALEVPEGRLLAITIGDVNPNKRIRSVLEALRDAPDLASRIFYVIIGSQNGGHATELINTVKQFGLERAVRFVGYAPDELLASYLIHADFCVTLRYPTTETASASAIEQLTYGKPLIVSDTGFYVDLPGDCVLKVPVDGEAAGLTDAMRRLAGSSLLRQEMGARASAYAKQTFRAEQYAARILEIGAEVLDAKPLLAFVDRVGRELSRMGTSDNYALPATVAAVSAALFGE